MPRSIDDLDLAHAHAHAHAHAAGLESRYASLGPVGHHFANDMVAKMTAAIAWVRE